MVRTILSMLASMLVSQHLVADASSYRFYPRGVGPKDLPKSMAVSAPLKGSKPGEVTPEFSSSKKGYEARIEIKEGTSLYGTGEVAGPLLRNGQISETWNTDAYGYSDKTPSLYQSHPWVLAVRADGSAYGALADTTYKLKIDLTKGIRFVSEETPFSVVVIEGSSPQEVVMELSRIIGKMELPPLWSLGYQQCRYSYETDEIVREVAGKFRELKIPADVMWMDIDYMDGFRIFTFDEGRFPNPKATNQWLHENGFRGVWMIDPGVKIDEGYFVFDQGTEGDHWVKDASGQAFVGKVWPGDTHFPDFTRPQTRQWWSGLYKDFLAQGIDGVWNDMNEPAVFEVESKTMPLNNVHRGGGDLTSGTHSRYHNVYGMLMAKASREGILKANPGKRPFLLTRANYISGSKYAATWTGDNTSDYDHLYWSIPMILNLGLSGQPFSGADIGGFVGSPSKDLFQKWMAVGAFYPFSRNHTSKDTDPQEPWAYDQETVDISRTAVEWRYRLMPYLYTVFREATQTGLPVMRPVFFADPADQNLRNEDHAFLLGKDLMVQPKLTADAEHTFSEPKGVWKEVRLEGHKSHPSLPTLKARAGSIIPIAALGQNTDESREAELSLIVTLDENGEAEGELYEDATDGFGYKKGQYALIKYKAKKDSSGRVKLTKVNQEGNYKGAREPVNMIIL